MTSDASLGFALFQLPTYREGFSQSLPAFYSELTEAVRVADRLGWQRVLVSEHHFHYYGGAVPNPAVVLAAWARETKNIRLAAGVSLVPLRHPLQVAEDYALVDQLAEGRFDMGVSRGFVPHEFEAFGDKSARDLGSGDGGLANHREVLGWRAVRILRPLHKLWQATAVAAHGSTSHSDLDCRLQ